MNCKFFTRTARLTACAIGTAVAVACADHLSEAHAQTAASSGGCPSWIDSATGKRTRTIPAWLTSDEILEAIHNGRVHSAGTGQDMHTADGGETWINSMTGRSISTIPTGLAGTERLDAIYTGRVHNAITGRNFVLVPCRPPGMAPSPSGG